MNTESYDPMHYEQAKAYFEGDLFATEATGILIDEAQPGYATVSMRNRALVQNAKGGVMGGALYTLADFAASIADWMPDEMNTTVDGSIQYVSLAKGSMLYANARCEHRGRTIGYYRVRVTDDLDTLVAVASFTLMHRPLVRS